jgi:hypothetical protein
VVDIKPEQVPKKVVRAAEKAWEKDTESFRPTAKTIAAALNEWLGMTWACRGKGTPPHLLFLPLPQEASDE